MWMAYPLLSREGPCAPTPRHNKDMTYQHYAVCRILVPMPEFILCSIINNKCKLTMDFERKRLKTTGARDISGQGQSVGLGAKCEV